MKLSKIEITGFKSFKNPTTIGFQDGITGVVGPNGCGKSNIVDALLWVMGSGTISQLRGNQMEDVIFSGTQKHPPSDFAEVQLILEKDEGLWPADFKSFSEIEIVRKLRRGGDSNYFINSKPCLLRDIHGLLSGIETQSWNIVEQDTISALVSSKPANIKTFIDQAAGISQFKNKKRLAEKKLKNTMKNFIRLQDILTEQQKHLKKLEKQSTQATAYKELKEKINLIEIHQLYKAYQQIEKKIEETKKNIQTFSQDQKTYESSLKSLQEDYQKSRSASESIYDQIKNQGENLKEELSKINKSEIEIQKLNTFIDSKTEGQSQWTKNVLDFKKFQEEKSKKIQKLKNFIQEDRHQISSLEENFQNKEAQLEKYKLQTDLLKKQSEEEQKKYNEFLKKEFNKEENVKNLSDRFQKLNQEVEKSKTEIKNQQSKYEKLQNSYSQIIKKLNSQNPISFEDLNLSDDTVHLQFKKRNLENLYKELTKKEGRWTVEDEKFQLFIQDILSQTLHFVQKDLENSKKTFEKQQVDLKKIKILKEEACLFNSQSEQIKTDLLNQHQKIQHQLNSCVQQKEKAKQSINQVQFSLIEKRKDLKNKESEISFLNQSIKEIASKEAQFSKTSVASHQSIVESQNKLKTKKEHNVHLKEDFQKKSKFLNKLEVEYQNKTSHCKDLENEISKLSKSIHEISQNKHPLEIECEALLVERKNLKEKAEETYQTDLPHLKTSLQEKEYQENHLSKLQSQLQRIGQINLLAFEEYKTLKSEYEELKKQFDDLEKSKSELEQVILEMDQISNKKFKKTFDEVNRLLSQIFVSIFEGGSASLSLTQEKDSKIGVEILACPPGKKLKTLKLLSGGEKSLTALCMIFALFLVSDSSFCVLDEVDAALDDSNTHRFNSLIIEMAKKCQVILITHNKYSMKQCHRLYGVTMQEKGITELVSVDMKNSNTKEKSKEYSLS